MKKLKKNVLIALVAALVAAAAWGGFRLGGNFGGGNRAKSDALVFSSLPVAELATREIKWKVVLHVVERFPAREYVVSRIAAVKAGFDLGKMNPEKDVRFDAAAGQVTIRLPRPEVFSVAWSGQNVLMDRHSPVAALLTRTTEDEAERRLLFDQALLSDLGTVELLSFDAMTEALKSVLSPYFETRGFKVEYVMDSGGGDFRRAVADYFEKQYGHAILVEK
ncbi:MAG: DUF4230 domain-containing protein [Victivallaceae bacterium]|nr:DUF4230 domain-containing protein [Victivallaceae bacterium]